MRIRISTRAFKKLKSLGEEVVSEIDSRLRAGEPCSAIADWIQKDLGQLKDIQRDSLKKSLERYRETELREKTLLRIAEAQHKSPLKTVVRRLNALDELEEMVQVQRVRFNRVLGREQELPKGIRLKDAAEEMRLLKDMLVDLGRLQLETGLLARAPKTFKGQMTTPDGEVREFEWTQEQEELFRSIEAAESYEAHGS